MTIEPDRPERILEWMVGEQYDIGITDGFFGHPSVERREINIRTVCIFPQGHHLSRLKSVFLKDLVDENSYIPAKTASSSKAFPKPFKMLS